MKALALSAVVAWTVLVSVPADAAQTNSNGQVVHSNPIPVVLHRLVPPNRGVHVYQGRAGRR